MVKITFIGDVHGKVREYLRLTRKLKNPSLQVGDFGMGFMERPRTFGKGNVFIRGNHDNPAVCAVHHSYLGDYGMWNGIFFVSGSYSPDKNLRTEGVDWWPEEEMSYDKCTRAIQEYCFFETTVCRFSYGTNCSYA